MDKETYEALKFLLHHSSYGGPNDKTFWNNLRLVENWVQEAEKEYV